MTEPISDEDLSHLTGEINESKVDSTPVIVSKQNILETEKKEDEEQQVVEIIEEEPTVVQASTEISAQKTEEDDRSWGLTTAFGGWGSIRLDIMAEDDSGRSNDEEPPPTSDAELDDMSQKMEAITASTTGALSSALWSAVGGAAAATSANKDKKEQGKSNADDAVDQPASDAELANMANQMESAAVETLSSALWSTFDAVNKGVSELKLPAAGIDIWIDDLEQKEQDKDPHKTLRDSLHAFVEKHRHSSYEEWVEHLLVTTEGWDEGSAVVDQTFYYERSVHRNLWNEKNVEDGIGPDDQDTQRAYVQAREKPMGTHAFSLKNMKDPDYDEDFTGAGSGMLPSKDQIADDEDEIIFEDLAE